MFQLFIYLFIFCGTCLKVYVLGTSVLCIRNPSCFLTDIFFILFFNFNKCSLCIPRIKKNYLVSLFFWDITRFASSDNCLLYSPMTLAVLLVATCIQTHSHLWVSSNLALKPPFYFLNQNWDASTSSAKMV